MKTILISLIILICLMPNTALAQDDLNPRRQIAPCRESELVNYLMITDYTQRLPVVYDSLAVGDLMSIAGEQVEWLGYAPRNLPEYWLLERQGIEYGFKGINLDLLEPAYEIYLNTDRYTFSRYDDGTFYFVTHTTNYEYARADGTAHDYHITAHPNGGACMWLVASQQLDFLFKAESY